MPQIAKSLPGIIASDSTPNARGWGSPLVDGRRIDFKSAHGYASREADAAAGPKC